MMEKLKKLLLYAGAEPEDFARCQMDVQISSALLGTEGHAFVDEKIDCGKIETPDPITALLQK